MSPINKWKPEQVSNFTEKWPKVVEKEDTIMVSVNQKYPTLSQEDSEKLEQIIKKLKEVNA